MANTTPTLSQLLATYSVEQLAQSILGVYQAAGFPVTAWQPFGTERTRVSSIATVGSVVSSNYLPQIAASGLLALANTIPAAQAFIPLTADQVYDTQPLPAQPAIGYMSLTNSSTTSYTISPSAFIVKFQLTGNRYTNINALTIPANTTITAPVTALFQSSGPGSIFNDPSNQGGISGNSYVNNGTNLLIITPFPGVGINNPPATSQGAHTGPSQGSIVLSLPGSPFNSYIIVNIVISGNQVGSSAYFTYSLNGSLQSSAIQMTATYTIPNTNGIVLDFADASESNPSNFYAGDSWTFNVPGDWKIQAGTDQESYNSLVTRSLLQWNRTSAIPTMGYYESLIRNTPNVGNQVQAVIIAADPNINNRVNACVSGPDGYMSPQVLLAIQANVNAYSEITDNVLVFPPQTATIDFLGTITVLPTATSNPVVPLPAIQNEVQVALTEYIQSVPINGIIYLSSIIEIIKEQTGVVDVNTSTLQIIVNGTPQTGNYTLGNTITYVQAVSVVTNFQFQWVIL
jgi:hypothetical protein